MHAFVRQACRALSPEGAASGATAEGGEVVFEAESVVPAAQVEAQPGREPCERFLLKGGIKADEVWLSPELSDLQSKLLKAFGRVGAASAPESAVRALLGEVVLPGGLAAFRISLQSSAPQEHLRAVWMSAEGRCNAVSLEALDPLSDLLVERPASSRMADGVMEVWLGRVNSVIREQALELAQEARRRLVTLQSRRAREVQSVFDVRLREQAEAGEGSDGVSVQDLIQELRRAQEHVSDHFDPDRLLIHIEPLLVLWIWPQRKARKTKGAG